MKTNTLLVAAITSTLLTGCAGFNMGPPRMAIEDLRTMKIDCANKEAQIRFLESQIPTSNQRMAAAFEINGLTEFLSALKGQKSEQAKLLGREYEASAKLLIWQLETHCPNKTQHDYEAQINSQRHDLQARK
jgi:hypothetical protein